MISSSSPSISYRNPGRCVQSNQSPSFIISRKFLSSGSYVSEMRKSAFEGNILRLIRSEIQSELDYSPILQVSSNLNLRFESSRMQNDDPEFELFLFPIKLSFSCENH